MSLRPRFRFFGGKGGVGKTTIAAASALHAAEHGDRVLLVSTDPAHSLGDALGRRLSARPTRIPTRRGVLAAVELDADRALERWLAARRRPLRTIAARGTYLDEDDVDRLLALSLPGVDELIGLIELHRLATESARRAARDGRPIAHRVAVDTAPTGHTLRLLAMPDTLARIAGVLADMLAKHRFLGESLAGEHRRDAADALVAEIEGEARALRALLRDSARCRFTWILLAEPLALEEAQDGVRALEDAGICVDELLVNRVTPRDGDCGLCGARAGAEQTLIARLPAMFPRQRVSLLPALDREPRGPGALRPLGTSIARAAASRARATAAPHARPPAARRAGAPATARTPASRAAHSAARAPDWLDALAPRDLRVLAFAGKGGVGKTTAAAAVALVLSERHPQARVLALSTDPAHSLGDALGQPLGDDERAVRGAPGLFARELDAGAAFAVRRDRYRASVDEIFDALLRGSRFDVAYDRDVVRELIDLAPPGLDELFGILSLVDALAGRERPPYDVVVLDTAPTGHAVRLFAMPDAALEWVHALLAILLKYRAVVGLGELASDLLDVARDLRELRALLRDPARARRRRHPAGGAAATRDGAAGARVAPPRHRGRRGAGQRDHPAGLRPLPSCGGGPGAGDRRAPLRRSRRRGPAVRYDFGSGRSSAAARRRGADSLASEVAVAMNGKAETATYVYALVQRRRAPVMTRAPRGLPGTGRARALDAGDGLWLIVADAPLARYGSAPLEARLRDLEWVAACATAHEAVVEFAARAGTTIPLKLFTLFNSDERAVEHIARMRPAIERVLGRVAGRQEWGVRVRLDEAKARRQRLAGARRATAGVAAGTRFLVLKKQQQQAVREALARGREDVEAAFEALAGVADDARRREVDTVEGGSRLVLDAAFLLAPSRLARFKKAARATAARLARHGDDLTLSGPWPPYNFVAGVR